MRALFLLLLLELADIPCRVQEQRCIERCNRENTIGSMEHLNCKARCWEGYLECQKYEKYAKN